MTLKSNRGKLIVLAEKEDLTSNILGPLKSTKEYFKGLSKDRLQNDTEACDMLAATCETIREQALTLR